MATERKLISWWQSFRGTVKTTKGESLEVIFPGKFYPSGGPDFQGAILKLMGEIISGDIEAHTHSSLWYKHRHHLDQRFKNVILHLVLKDDIGQKEPIVLAFEDNFPGEPDFIPCGTISLPKLGYWGERRFLEKKDYFIHRLGKETPSQVLYEELMGALGYSENKDCFILLAHRLPLWRLAGKDRGTIFHQLKEEGAKIGWRFSGVRPVNLPLRRLEGISYVLANYGENLLPVLEEGIRQKDRKRLENTLRVPGLLGQARVAEMMVNVVLPCFSALGYKEAEGLYLSYPKTGENFITRLMKRRLSLSRTFLAVQQQGLIHIYKNFCLKGDCLSCVVKT